MKRTCEDCYFSYEDQLCTTTCPHERFISDEVAAQKDAAVKMLGKDIAFNHLPHERHRAVAMDAVGMLAINDLPGWFAPHLFVEFKGEK